MTLRKPKNVKIDQSNPGINYTCKSTSLITRLTETELFTLTLAMGSCYFGEGYNPTGFTKARLFVWFSLDDVPGEGHL